MSAYLKIEDSGETLIERVFGSEAERAAFERGFENQSGWSGYEDVTSAVLPANTPMKRALITYLGQKIETTVGEEKPSHPVKQAIAKPFPVLVLSGLGVAGAWNECHMEFLEAEEDGAEMNGFQPSTSLDWCAFYPASFDSAAERAAYLEGIDLGLEADIEDCRVLRERETDAEPCDG